MDENDRPNADSLHGCGFQRLTQIDFLASRTLPNDSSAAVHLKPVQGSDRSQFEALLETTQQATHDCPQLDDWQVSTGLIHPHSRDPDRGGSEYFIHFDGRAIGALVLQRNLSGDPTSDVLEIRYFGICPRDRGHGHAVATLQAVRQMAATESGLVVAAVAVTNTPARCAYEAAEFRVWASRVLWAKPFKLTCRLGGGDGKADHGR